MSKCTTFDSLSELEQLSIRSQISGKFITSEKLETAASNGEWVASAVNEHIKSYGKFTKNCPFIQISELERKAIRYHLRITNGFGGNYEATVNKLAEDSVLLNAITLKYKEYALAK